MFDARFLFADDVHVIIACRFGFGQNRQQEKRDETDKNIKPDWRQI
jgi:hypothetical protein